MGPGPVWTGGKSRPHRDSIPDRPARGQSLYRTKCVVWQKKTRKREEHTVENGRGRLLIAERKFCGISISHEKPSIARAAKFCLGQNYLVRSVEGTRQ